MEHWEELAPGGLRLLWDDALFPPGTDSFLLSALAGAVMAIIPIVLLFLVLQKYIMTGMSKAAMK